MAEVVDPAAAAVTSAWLITFAVHGTAWLALVWLGTALFRRLPDGVVEAAWKLAVLGPLLTASVQLAWVPAPADGWLPLGTITLPAAATAVAPPACAPEALLTTPTETGWPEVSQAIVLFALVGAALAQARGLWLRLRLHRALAGRRSAPAALVQELARLAARVGGPAGVRVSVASGLATPIAFGVLWPEVCVPERALRDVGREPLRGMLAHELAHLQRRDPLWLSVLDLLQRTFFWQPLLRIARTRLARLAEYRCDALAAHWTSPTAVAGGLVEVAGWIAGRPHGQRLVPAMAAHGSGLKRRVERLLDEPFAATGGGRTWLWPVGVGLLVATVTAMPGMPLPPIAPAPAPVLVPTPPSMPADPADTPAFASLGRERAALQHELAGLSAELAGLRVRDPEIARLLHELERRLQRLDLRRAELEARLAPRSKPNQ